MEDSLDSGFPSRLGVLAVDGRAMAATAGLAAAAGAAGAGAAERRLPRPPVRDRSFARGR